MKHLNKPISPIQLFNTNIASKLDEHLYEENYLLSNDFLSSVDGYKEPKSSS